VLRISFILFFLVGFAKAQNSCRIDDINFSDGEVLEYEVYYDWGPIWVNAARTSFSVKKTEIGKRKVFHFLGEGSTHKNYDWFFKVRDTFQCWADTHSLKPLHYVRNSREGGTRVYNDNYFNYDKKQATFYKLEKKKLKRDSVKLKDCTFDVLSMVYYARTINYKRYQVGSKIPISLYLDGEINDTLYIRYLGEEKVKTALGEKNCIVFSPLLIKGTIFSGGETMKVWVTNDEKKIPVLIVTPIIVGNVQVKIKSVNGSK
jgi:hypothetical protein